MIQTMPIGMEVIPIKEFKQVFKPGSWVLIGDDVPATVRQVCIAEDGVTYEVAWWNERTRTTAWLSAHEVRASCPVLANVGFVQDVDK